MSTHKAKGHPQITRVARKLVALVPPLRNLCNPWIALPVIILLAFGLRLYRLDYQELRGDEAFGYFFSLPSFGQIVQTTLVNAEPHPLGYPFLEKVWIALAGRSEFALRFLSVWFGVLSVALLYRLGRRLELPAPAAAVSAALLAVSPYAIWHSQDARMYSMALALTIGSTLLAWQMLSRPRPASALVYVAVTWLALNIHYSAASVVLAQNLSFVGYLLFFSTRRRPSRRILAFWLGAQLLVGLLYLPWLIHAVGILQGYQGNAASPAFGEMLVRSLAVLGAGESVPAGQRLPVALAAGALLIAGIWRLARAGPGGRPAAWLLASYLLVPLAVTWISAIGRPLFNERYLVVSLPPFCLLLAAAVFAPTGAGRPRILTRIHEWMHSSFVYVRSQSWLAAGVLIALLAFGTLPSLYRHYADPAYSKTRGWRELAVALGRLADYMPAAQARLAENYPDPTLWYYYRGPLPHLVLPPAPHDAARALQEVAQMATQGVEWVILPLQPTAGWDDGGIAQNALAQYYTPIGEKRVAGWPVLVYVRPPKQMTASHVEFAGGLTLIETAIQPQIVDPGGVLAVHLRWRVPPGGLAGSEKISLQLLDAGGALAAQTDVPFVEPADSSALAYGVWLPERLPAGDYRLLVILYDSARPGAPRLATADGADHVSLGTVTVH